MVVEIAQIAFLIIVAVLTYAWFAFEREIKKEDAKRYIDGERISKNPIEDFGEEFWNEVISSMEIIKALYSKNIDNFLREKLVVFIEEDDAKEAIAYAHRKVYRDVHIIMKALLRKQHVSNEGKFMANWITYVEYNKERNAFVVVWHLTQYGPK